PCGGAYPLRRMRPGEETYFLPWPLPWSDRVASVSPDTSRVPLNAFQYTATVALPPRKMPLYGFATTVNGVGPSQGMSLYPSPARFARPAGCCTKRSREGSRGGLQWAVPVIVTLPALSNEPVLSTFTVTVSGGGGGMLASKLSTWPFASVMSLILATA